MTGSALIPLGKNQPLGTAAWNTKLTGLRVHQPGDLLLGFAPNGDAPIGLPDNRHVLVNAGTRAGKGATFIIPNLIYYPGSVVVIDPKGENAIVTARRRGAGSKYGIGLRQRVVLLDPYQAVCTPEDDFKDLRGGFNPLDLIDPARPETIGDASRIADALVVSESSSDPYWSESARGLIKALILHVASSPDFKPDERNLVTVWRLAMAGDARRSAIAALSGGDGSTSGLALLFGAMKRNRAFNGAVAQAGEMYGNLEKSAPRTLASFTQIACTNLDFIETPEMQACLRRSSLKLSDLKTDRRGVSLYLSLPQAYMETGFRWLRMITALLIGEMERFRQPPANGYPVLMILDEFAALKRMRTIENAAAQIAGFGVRMVFVVQSLAQLRDVHKENWETLIANSGAKLFFCNDDNFTREYVSKLIGETEIVRVTRTTSETRGTTQSTATGMTRGESVTESLRGQQELDEFGLPRPPHSKTLSRSDTGTTTTGMSASRSVSEAETIHKRALVTPDEVGRLFGDRTNPLALVLFSGQQPMVLRRASYFRHVVFVGRYSWHPDHPQPETIAQREARKQREARELEEQEAKERHIREARERYRMHQLMERRRKQEEARAREAREFAEIKRQCEEEEARLLEVERNICWMDDNLRFLFLLIWLVWPVVILCGVGMPLFLIGFRIRFLTGKDPRPSFPAWQSKFMKIYPDAGFRIWVFVVGYLLWIVVIAKRMSLLDGIWQQMGL